MKSQAENKNVFVERLNDAIKMDGRSARQIAISAGISAARMSVYTLGKCVPPVDAVRQIAVALGVPAPWLAGMSDDRDGIVLDEEEVALIRTRRAARHPGQASNQHSAQIAA